MKIETVEDRVEEAYQILRKMCEKPAKDECSLYAELLAQKLRALDENRREIVMHEISDLMFRATMKNQNFWSLASPYSSAPGGLHSTAHSVVTYFWGPLSFRPYNSRILRPLSHNPLEEVLPTFLMRSPNQETLFRQYRIILVLHLESPPLHNILQLSTNKQCLGVKMHL